MSEALINAIRDLLASRQSTFKSRNGREMGIEDSSGEKMWIVPFDEMARLEFEYDAIDAKRAAQATPQRVDRDGNVCLDCGAHSARDGEALLHVPGCSADDRRQSAQPGAEGDVVLVREDWTLWCDQSANCHWTDDPSEVAKMTGWTGRTRWYVVEHRPSRHLIVSRAE